jgi:hypothetical protein
MAELDDIVQNILLQGDSELLHALEKIGSQGAEHIAKLAEACEKGASPMEALGGSIAIVEAAIATATVALVAFIETQNEAILKTAFLAEAMGTTASAIQGVEAAFAAAGVSVQTTEKFMNRLTVSIAQQWPQIADSIRNYATANDAAQERVVSATIRVKEAQSALAHANEDYASKSAANNSRVEHSLITLQFAAQKAFQQMRADATSVASAVLGVEAAEQALAAARGQPVSESEKKQLEIKQLELNLDKAREQREAARLTEQKNRAEAVQKQKDIEQAAADAAEKRARDAEQAQLTRLKLEEAVKAAITQREQALASADKLALTNVESVSTALKGIVSGNKEAAKSVDLTQVSVVNLERALFRAASVGGKAPTGIQALHELSKVLAADTDELIPKSERLALVQRLSATAMTNSGVATSELLKALERGPEVFNAYVKAAEGQYSTTEHAIHDVENFKNALTTFNLNLGLAQQNLAALASPTFTAFFESLTKSLQESDGFLHLFVEGIKGIGAAIDGIIVYYQTLAQWIDKAFDLKAGTGMKILLGTLAGLVAAFAAPWAAIPALIAIVVTAIGYLYQNWQKVKEGAEKAWEAVKDTAVYKFLDGVIERIKEAVKWWKELWGKKGDTGVGDAKVKAVGEEAGASGNPDGVKLAGGGEVHGPGTTTSDSVFARLSRGEFVVRAAAVQNYGTDLFHKLNAMSFPGFAQGGLVPSPVRLGSGSGSNPARSTLNLTIGDRTFSGLNGPASVIDDLASYAVGRQTSAAGRNPSWFK